MGRVGGDCEGAVEGEAGCGRVGWVSEGRCVEAAASWQLHRPCNAQRHCTQSHATVTRKHTRCRACQKQRSQHEPRLGSTTSTASQHRQ